MLHHFFAREVNGQKTKGLFDTFEIASHPEAMEKQGQYPVIFLTLKWLKKDGFDKNYAYFENLLQKLYETHRYLLTGDILSEDERVIMRSILQQKTSPTSVLNNLRVHSMLSKSYGDSFGFTKEKGADLLQKTNLTEQAEGIREWYNGYTIGGIRSITLGLF